MASGKDGIDTHRVVYSIISCPQLYVGACKSEGFLCYLKHKEAYGHLDKLAKVGDRIILGSPLGYQYAYLCPTHYQRERESRSKDYGG